MVLYHNYTELDIRQLIGCCDLVVFSSGQQQYVDIIVTSAVLWDFDT